MRTIGRRPTLRLAGAWILLGGALILLARLLHELSWLQILALTR